MGKPDSGRDQGCAYCRCTRNSRIDHPANSAGTGASWLQIQPFSFFFGIVDNTWTDRWSIARYCKQCRLTMPSRFSIACSGFCWWPFLLWQCFLFSFLLLDMLLLGQLPLGSQGLVLFRTSETLFFGKGRAPDFFKERIDSATTFCTSCLQVGHAPQMPKPEYRTGQKEAIITPVYFFAKGSQMIP